MNMKIYKSRLFQVRQTTKPIQSKNSEIHRSKRPELRTMQYRIYRKLIRTKHRISLEFRKLNESSNFSAANEKHDPSQRHLNLISPCQCWGPVNPDTTPNPPASRSKVWDPLMNWLSHLHFREKYTEKAPRLTHIRVISFGDLLPARD